MIYDIERTSVVDGPGIRTTVFFKGCNLSCAWCHNPESQRAEAQLLYYRDRCIGCGACERVCANKLTSCSLCGACAAHCPQGARELCGAAYTVDELMEEILKDRDFYAATGGGVTFSGGECMLQIDFLEQILRACRAQGIHTAVDTAGYVPFARFARLLDCADLFLYDVKCMDAERHKHYTGVDNSLILDNLARLLASGAAVWVRVPIIPTVNDEEREMLRIRAFLDSCAHPVQRVALLPYHEMGTQKYAALGKEAAAFSPPSEELMARLRGVFACG